MNANRHFSPCQPCSDGEGLGQNESTQTSFFRPLDASRLASPAVLPCFSAPEDLTPFLYDPSSHDAGDFYGSCVTPGSMRHSARPDLQLIGARPKGSYSWKHGYTLRLAISSDHRTEPALPCRAGVLAEEVCVSPTAITAAQSGAASHLGPAG